jgi:Cof subfamily protein (haloacid dehalogenase superfamily)
MRKINYALIVSDFDGTLVKADGTISDRTQNIIRRYVDDGGIFAISTGRMPAGILPRVKELGLKGVVCCGQGSAIVDIESNEVLLEGNIPNEIAVKICKKMEEMGLHIHVYSLWDYYSNMDDDALKMYEGIVKSKAILVQDKPMSQFVKETGMNPCKVLAMVAPEDNEKVLVALEKEAFPDCDVTRSSVYLVEVSNAKYSKGTSVEFLSQKYNIPMEKTIAVGDQVNDLSMIEIAGLGIAVQNADENLKARALVCEYTNEEDALAHIIEKYGYLEE